MPNRHPGLKWIRTCQECGNKQSSSPPPAYSSSYALYAEAKCKKCTSRGLDFGKWVEDKPETKEE